MIPRIIHFIYFPGPSIPNLNLCHYIAIKSNIIVNKPEKVYFYVPEGTDINDKVIFGQLIKLINEFSDLIQIKYVEDIEQIYGNPVYYNSHKVDILKARILFEQGGIIGDLDSIAVNPLPEDWYDSEVPIMCTEEVYKVPKALCFGFLLSPARSDFFTKVLEQYKHYYFPYNKDQWIYEWAEFAVNRPWEIYNEDPSKVHVIPASNFEPFYLDYEDIEDLYFLDKDIPNCYQVHLWENRNHNLMKVLSERYFKTANTTLAKLGRDYV